MELLDSDFIQERYSLLENNQAGTLEGIQTLTSRRRNRQLKVEVLGS